MSPRAEQGKAELYLVYIFLASTHFVLSRPHSGDGGRWYRLLVMNSDSKASRLGQTRAPPLLGWRSSENYLTLVFLSFPIHKTGHDSGVLFSRQVLVTRVNHTTHFQ